MAEANILAEFGEDDVYKLFLTDDFDVKAVTSSAVQLVAVTEHLAKLSAGISLLDKELHQQVTTHYVELLLQASGIETLECVLNAVHLRIQALLSSSERLKQTVLIPYKAVSSQTAMLMRLQITCDYLRRIIRIIQLCNRLTVQSGNPSEIVKAAQSLDELDYLTEGTDFTGLHLIDRHLNFMRNAREKINSQANELLLKGIETQDWISVGTAVQVFDSLQVLASVIHELLGNIKERIIKNAHHSLDVRILSHQSQDASQKIYGPGRAAIPLTGNTAAFRVSLWTNMESLMNNILDACQQVQHLQNVLIKKKSTLNYTKFLQELEAHDESDIVFNLWQAITEALTREFSLAANESMYIKQAFEVEFPKLLCMFNSFLKGLHSVGFSIQSTGSDMDSGKKSSSTLTDEGRPTTTYSKNSKEILSESVLTYLLSTESLEEALRKALLPFENAYLSRCLSRLTDSINVIYAGEVQNLPTTEDIEGIVKAVRSELLAASVDQVLLLKVSKNVFEMVNFFVEKCQYLVSTDDSSTQVIDTPNSSQMTNARVVHLLSLFHTKIVATLKETQCTDESFGVVETALQSVLSLIDIVVEPLIHCVSLAVEAIIITMHKEDFSMQVLEVSAQPDPPCSLYMKELQTFVARSQRDYFSLYPDCDSVINGLQRLGSHTVEFFVRHASLVRPVGDSGKMRLAADCAQMEMAISPWCQKAGDLGRMYRLLRSFRPLLFQTAAHISQSPAIGDIIPYSLVLHLLFARAPVEMKSPHEVAGMTIEEYSLWLDDHTSEKERLIMIKGCLEKYVNSVKQRQDKEFCSLYPIMVDLLQRGMEAQSY